MKSADFSIGTIIYILIVVIATIVSAAKKKTKKTVITEDKQPSKPVKTWEKILAETLDIPGTEEKIPEPEPIMQDVEIQYDNKHADVIQEYNQTKLDYAEKIQAASKHEYHSIDMDKAANETKVVEEIRQTAIDFDIRKAVIFSEILNKKYS